MNDFYCSGFKAYLINICPKSPYKTSSYIKQDDGEIVMKQTVQYGWTGVRTITKKPGVYYVNDQTSSAKLLGHYPGKNVSHIYIPGFTDYDFAGAIAKLLKQNRNNIRSHYNDRQGSLADCRMIVQQLYDRYTTTVILCILFLNRYISEPMIIKRILKAACL